LHWAQRGEYRGALRQLGDLCGGLFWMGKGRGQLPWDSAQSFFQSLRPLPPTAFPQPPAAAPRAAVAREEARAAAALGGGAPRDTVGKKAATGSGRAVGGAASRPPPVPAMPVPVGLGAPQGWGHASPATLSITSSMATGLPPPAAMYHGFSP